MEVGDAKNARALDHTDTDHLEGLEQTPQEFYHHGLMMQVRRQQTLIIIIHMNQIYIYTQAVVEIHRRHTFVASWSKRMHLPRVPICLFRALMVIF